MAGDDFSIAAIGIVKELRSALDASIGSGASIAKYRDVSTFCALKDPTDAGVVIIQADASVPLVSGADDPCDCLKQSLEHDLALLKQCSFATLLLMRRPTIPQVVQWMRLGASSVLPYEVEPHGDQCSIVIAADLLKETIQVLSEESQKRAARARACLRMTQALDDMNQGELYVLRAVIDGELNKKIAKALEISERTVEARRKRLFEKTGATSLAMLVRLVVETIGIEELNRRCGAMPKIKTEMVDEFPRQPHFDASPNNTDEAFQSDQWDAST